MPKFSTPITCLSPPAKAVKLCLLYAKVEHETETIDLMTGEQNKPDFVALNPAHCVPTIEVGIIDNTFLSRNLLLIRTKVSCCGNPVQF